MSNPYGGMEWLKEILQEPGSLEVVEHEVSQVMRDQGVQPAIYVRLGDGAKAQIEKRLGDIADPETQPSEDRHVHDNFCLKYGKCSD